MLDALRSLFRADTGPRAEVPAEVAVAALLVDAARADGVYHPAERRAVGTLLQAMFGLDAAGADALRVRGEASQAEAADIVRFTRVIKAAMDEPQRIRLMEALWEVVLADHERAPDEDALLRKLAPLIAVDDRDSAAARQRVLARVG